MTYPQLQKNWTVSPNVRQAFTTLIGVSGWYAYENKTRMLAVGWTVKFTSNGATGPASGADTTDRITSAATFNVRATVAASPQSWYVLQNADGIQILFAYQGATDDIIRISYSQGGLFTLAGTTTHQPTATDEIVMSTAATIVNATTSLDRVMSIFCASDTTAWRCVLFRSGVQISCLSLDKVTRIAPSTTLTVPYIFGNFIKLNREIFNDDGAGAVTTPTYPEMQVAAIGAATFRGWGGRVFTLAVSRVCRMYGASVFGAGDGGTNSNTMATGSIYQVMTNTFCASLGGTGALCWPIIVWGEKTANLDGPWATVIDWIQVVTTSLTIPATGVFVPGLHVGDNPISAPARTNWFVALGAAAVWPWKDASPVLEQL